MVELHPAHPAGEFLLGGVEWHVLTTGPSELVGSARGDSAFFTHMDSAIRLGEAAVKANPKDASARFFLGGAYGYEARYLALQERWWDAYQKGKRGVGHLERVVKERPDFADAHLGLGIYHYYADVIPSVLKFFSTFVGMNGDRERGLREIHHALREGTMVREEARFFLAEIYSTFEKDHWKALEFSRSLRDEFPENELFAWMNARVLDELHHAGLAEREWEWLRTKARGGGQRGFVEYRLARTLLSAGDFAGAASRFQSLVRNDALGSRRMAMWARVRLMMALDFLGRHDEAAAAAREALAVDASSTAKELAQDRLAEAKRDPTVLPLSELEEIARILNETGTHGEPELRAMESKLTGPSRGLSGSSAARFTAAALDLAEARLRRGDPNGCVSAIDGVMDAARALPKEERAKLMRLRAHALARSGRLDDALRELKSARPKADWETREAIDRDRRLLEKSPPPAADPSAASSERVPLAPDRGELTLELEMESNGTVRRLPLALARGGWRAREEIAPGTRYRFVIDDHRRRIDPYAERVILLGDEAWGIYPKQTNSPPPGSTASP